MIYIISDFWSAVPVAEFSIQFDLDTKIKFSSSGEDY